ncbi:MAG: sulfatase-like hydrolase/transferase [Altererythrobacter sp.]
MGGVTAAMAYLVLTAACWTAIVLAAYQPRAWLRWLWGISLTATGYVLLVYEHASHHFMTYDVFVSMIYSVSAADEALAQNGRAFLSAIWQSLVIGLGVAIKPRRIPALPPRLLAGGPWLILGALTAMLFVRGGEGGRGLPAGMTGTAYSILALYEEVTRDRSERLPATAKPTRDPLVRNIVLMIDESIAPQYLGINDARGVPTPLSAPPDGVSVQNFGIAAAIAGCSTGVNLTLRHGGTRDNYQTTNSRHAAIWAYAKAAGLHTVYIDGQRVNGLKGNQVGKHELENIDRVIQFPDVAVVDRDIAIAHELARQLDDPTPKFILVNKVGAHFPVHDKFPDRMAKYKPILPRGRWGSVSDTGSRAGFGGTPEEWRRYRNSYRNTLLWNVGEFWRVLFSEADLSQTSIIYTSDHGQVLHEDGSPGTTTHCSADPPAEEGAVLLLAVEGKGASGLDWGRWAAANRNRSSHYMIFPSLLRMMGFAADDIRENYGPSLLEKSTDPMTFNRLFNARLGRKPEWRQVEPAKLIRPPESD